jgi:hypothetical protein
VGISSWSPKKTLITFCHIYDSLVLTLSCDLVKNVDGMKIK